MNEWASDSCVSDRQLGRQEVWERGAKREKNKECESDRVRVPIRQRAGAKENGTLRV